MIVLKMELWPHGMESQARQIAHAKIINDGSGDERTGNYRVELYNGGNRLWKMTEVLGFPRKRLLGWDILCRALHDLLGKRNGLEKISQS